MSPQIPLFVFVAFLIAFCFPIFMIASLVRKNAPSDQGKSLFYGVIIFYVIYLAVVAFASFQGVFSENSIPPKIVQYTTLPLLLFLVGIIFNLSWFKDTLKNTPTHELILLHRFRLIGSFFLILLSLELLPPVFALVAGLGDLITALSSWWVAKQFQKGKPSHRTLAILWNTFGFVDILATSSMAILFTKLSMETGALGVEALTVFPFCFIPAFAPATIIFLHLSIYRKLLVQKFR